jgi:hypothetical protein
MYGSDHKVCALHRATGPGDCKTQGNSFCATNSDAFVVRVSQGAHFGMGSQGNARGRGENVLFGVVVDSDLLRIVVVVVVFAFALIVFAFAPIVKLL